jgi:hypothetical protein
MADAVIRVRFLREAEGGRRTDISGSSYGCPLFISGQAFDCRFLDATEDGYCLGHEYTIPIKFLTPNLALPLLGIGQKISLWEGKTIAEGMVLWVRRTEDVK